MPPVKVQHNFCAGLATLGPVLILMLPRTAIHFPLESEELMRAWPFVLLLLALPVGGLAAPRSNAAKALHELFTAAWDQEMQERPEDASELGDRPWNEP